MIDRSIIEQRIVELLQRRWLGAPGNDPRRSGPDQQQRLHQLPFKQRAP